MFRQWKLTHWIMLSMVFGIVVGYICHRNAASPEDAKAIAANFKVMTEIFLRLIKMLIAPLILSTLISGIASMDSGSAIGRIGLRALAWFVIAAILSFSIGLFFVNLTHPGTGLDLALPAAGASTDLHTSTLNLKDFLTHLFPKSVADAMATNQIMQILVFSLFFGVALSRIASDQGRYLKGAIDGLQEVMMRMTNMVMMFAPLGIFAALAAAVTIQGAEVLSTYGKLIGWFFVAMLVLWGALIAAGWLVLGGRMKTLLASVREPLMIAFSTASSEAAYPRLIEGLQDFGIRRRLVGFVLPLGYSFNLDGSMIYQAFAAVFIAQAYGVHMSLAQQLSMMLVLMVSSKGTAAVPRGSLVVVAAVLPMYGLPEAGLLLVMGIDQILDMGRTATNVLGNSIATAVIAKWEGELATSATTKTAT
ncbi:MAG: dicarboxylate/amino acid:cation symporter [Lautropia sp.]|nr:dicarboxylate/amino acid:cation symporter [Lautropia sp.]